MSAGRALRPDPGAPGPRAGRPARRRGAGIFGEFLTDPLLIVICVAVDDSTLVTRARSGDRAALDGLWQRHRRWVAAVLLAHMPNRASLDDLLQEVAVTMVERLPDLRDAARLRPWLRAVAVNRARHEARVNARRLSPDSLDRGGDELAAPDEAHAAQARDALSHVLAMARRLDPDYREPLLLKAVQGLSQREIAETLGLSVTTVETRLARARRLLRRQLAAGPEGAAATDIHSALTRSRA